MDIDKKTFTDMYIIAALLAYGFKPSSIDSSDPNRQRYAFSIEQMEQVYLIDDSKVDSRFCSVLDVEIEYLSGTLMLPPKYPSLLKSVKYSIISNRTSRDN